ncbi:MAG: type II restriction/modification system DNA methylase subunit YeeA [Candidatus Endobugula sp.]
MTPLEFKKKWMASTLKERSAAQEHFLDLCNLLGEKTPAEADPHGSWYAFEKGAKKTGGGDGWADVWMRHHFAIEYKGKHKDLNKALEQIQRYALALENPPLLIVCDMNTFIIHTNFTSTVHEIHTIPIEEIDNPENLKKLKWAFNDPEKFKPGITTQDVTTEAASSFSHIAQKLRDKGHPPQIVAHFLNKILFCFYAEDVELLPKKLVTKLLKGCIDSPHKFEPRLKALFGAMRNGGDFGVEEIEWFNGGLFNDDEVLSLHGDDIEVLYNAALLDWSNIQPSIFGTLFERGLDPSKRSQLGAHYTDPESIMKIVEPVINSPFIKEWEDIKAQIPSLMKKYEKGGKGSKVAYKEANILYFGFLEKLRNFKILDPACGSGNFLFLALHALKDIEHRVILDAEAMDLERTFPSVGPQNVYGIELNGYAAELARVTIWIGEIQWMLKHGYHPGSNPILKPLEQIEHRDSLITDEYSESSWPSVDVIIGNPPFIGGKKMRAELGDKYTEKLRGAFKERLPAIADLVTYFFEKARNQIDNGAAKRVGLVSTQSIRNGGSRTVLDRINDSGKIYNAWSDEPWVNDGADVRVSFICFCSNSEIQPVFLNGAAEHKILSDLTPQADNEDLDLTIVKSLNSNKNRAFVGTQKSGSFDVKGELARSWLNLPNPNSQPNSDVVKPWLNGKAITARNPDKWIVYFDSSISEFDASLYEKPFEHIKTHVHDELLKKIEKNKLESKSTKDMEKQLEKWWLHWRPRPELNEAIRELSYCIATVRVSKHRFFVWVNTNVVFDSRLLVIASDSWASFGVLSSKIHELWSLAKSSMHGVGNGPTYNAQSCFETFPFPSNLGFRSELDDSDKGNLEIVAAAKRLVDVRDNWLNPFEYVDHVKEIVPGLPDRIIPKDNETAKLIRKRTLTDLYNSQPAWLVKLQSDLDNAVLDAYGIRRDAKDKEILSHLCKLNVENA